MKPTDADARALALDTSTSFIVQAPAGSGKTELLIQRYLALLAVVDEPERIVAITFTKKAAAEMRERVINALDSASGAEPIAEHERTTRRLAHAALQRDAARKWRLRENASRMRIETFDALCLRIAAQMPWMSRLGAVPSPTEKPYDLYAAAARATVQLVQGSEPPAGALRRLLLHFDNAGALVNQLIGMLEKREQWLPIIGDGRQDMGAVRRRLEQQLAELITENLTLLRELLRGDLASRIARFAGRSAGDLPGASTADVPAWIEIADLLLTKKGDWRKAVTKALPYSLDDSHEELRLELCRVRTLPEPHFDDEQWRILCAVFEVLPMAASQLSNEFAARGESDFTALLFAALEALGPEDDPTDLGLALGSRIEHILVDEFQDTSRSQLRLLKKLTAGWDPTDGRTLFLVGDPMQSIYRFRQAEVGIFLSTRRHGIGSIVPESLKLTQNFRSQPRIVDWVDRVFRGILGHTEDPLSGTVPYARFTAAVAQPGPEPQAHAFFDKAQEEEAARVISLIPEDGTTAILVRARSHLTSIVAALRRAGIRFRAVEIYYLGERPIVQDLMALTFALLHPGDRVSWLAVLRAPWCGLTLADLLATSADKDRPIWSSIGVVTGEGAARIQRIRPAIDRALDERGRRSLRELVEGAWRLLDGPAFAQGQNDLDDAAAYFDLLETLDEGGDLARFDDLRKKVKELFAHPDANADGRIQVMTIHQAKGLEFDTVILPGLGARTREDDPPLLAFHEFGAEGLVVAAKPQVNEDRLYQYITHQENEKAENEAKRQLYVAVTRAKHTLHLLGCAAVKHTNSGIEASASAASFLKLLWNELGPEFQRALAAQVAAPVQEPQHIERRIRRVDLQWRAPGALPPIRWEHEEEPAIEERPITFEWAGDTRRHVGTVLHDWLQRFAETGVDAWSAPRIRSLEGAFRAALAGLGVPPSELDKATTTVAGTLERCLDSDRMRWVLAPHAEAECEYALTAWIDGRYRRVRIDRTFVDEAGVRWLIDYKTSTHEGGSREAFLENERRRYGAQLEMYARIISGIDQRPIRLALCFPLLDAAWVEWSVDVEQASGLHI